MTTLKELDSELKVRIQPRPRYSCEKCRSNFPREKERSWRQMLSNTWSMIIRYMPYSLVFPQEGV